MKSMMKKGKVHYDQESDIFSFTLTGNGYAHSLEFQNDDVIVDFDVKGDICGVVILDASKLLACPKTLFTELKSAELHFRVVDGTFTLSLSLQGKVAHQYTVHGENIKKEQDICAVA
jgi:uncharacterized protein YuzE